MPRLEASPPDDGLILRVGVRDTGPGIPPDKQDLLFRSFSQVGASQARTHDGTGLGLAICRKLAQLMGGDIWFQTPEEAGSEFVFAVQVSRAPGAPGMAKTQSPSEPGLDRHKLQGARVLVAEDNKVNSMLIVALLNKHGIRAQCAKNGLLACEAMQQAGGYDLIFMDLEMPEMDGIEATRRIRELEAGENKRSSYIIALTAEAMSGDREKCLAAGMNDYLSKPLRTAELLAALQRFTHQHTS
jgi:CheY-like chemotaxis protein